MSETDIFTPAHRAELYRHALRQTREPDMAEDIVQDVLLKAWRYRIHEARNPGGWFRVVLRNRVFDWRKHVKRRPHDEFDDEQHESPLPTPDVALAHRDADACELDIAHRAARAVERAMAVIATLPIPTASPAKRKRQERYRRWYAEHGERHRARVREYAWRNAEQNRERVRKWNAANPVRCAERMRRYYLEHRARLIASAKARYHAKRTEGA